MVASSHLLPPHPRLPPSWVGVTTYPFVPCIPSHDSCVPVCSLLPHHTPPLALTAYPGGSLELPPQIVNKLRRCLGPKCSLHFQVIPPTCGGDWKKGYFVVVCLVFYLLWDYLQCVVIPPHFGALPHYSPYPILPHLHCVVRLIGDVWLPFTTTHYTTTPHAPLRAAFSHPARTPLPPPSPRILHAHLPGGCQHARWHGRSCNHHRRLV